MLYRFLRYIHGIAPHIHLRDISSSVSRLAHWTIAQQRACLNSRHGHTTMAFICAKYNHTVNRQFTVLLMKTTIVQEDAWNLNKSFVGQLENVEQKTESEMFTTTTDGAGRHIYLQPTCTSLVNDSLCD